MPESPSPRQKLIQMHLDLYRRLAPVLKHQDVADLVQVSADILKDHWVQGDGLRRYYENMCIVETAARQDKPWSLLGRKVHNLATKTVLHVMGRKSVEEVAWMNP